MNIDEVGEYLEHKGLTDDEIDEYFAHFGVPGQKWGVRKARKQAAARTKSARKQVVIDAVKRDNKTQRRVATGAAFVATNIIASGIAKRAGLNKAFTISAVAIGTASVNSLMRVHGAQRLYEL